MRNFSKLGPVWVTIAALGLSACGGQIARNAPLEPTKPVIASIPENLLLDVNVAIFDPGIDTLNPNNTTTTPGIRRAEGHYVAKRISETLAGTGQWGTVRVVPESDREVDVMVSGKILESDGENLEIEARVIDARGQQWFERRYAERVNQFAYDLEARRRQEPFQNVYNRLANDMRDYLQRQDLNVLRGIRATTEMRFAARFAPEAFAEYLSVDSRGHYTLNRLPAENDPLLQRVRAIRVRDEAFVERLQDSYNQFDRNMIESYDHWRQESLVESAQESELKSQALARALGGALAVIGGVLAQSSSSSAARTAGVIGIGGGAVAMASGYEKNAEARIHTQAMKELSDSLNAEVQPQTIALTDRNIELTGTIEEQYAQWQDLLQQIYRLETGQDTAPAQVIGN